MKPATLRQVQQAWPWRILGRRLRYDTATGIWYRWHKHVCQPLYWRNYPTWPVKLRWTGLFPGVKVNRTGPLRGSISYMLPLSFRNGPKGSWLYRLQLNWICGPLDDWAHAQED